MTPAAVTALADRLEARGLLKRTRSADDRRKVMVELTAEAIRLSGEYYGPIAREGGQMLNTFGDDELAVVLRFLTIALDLQSRHLQALKEKLPAGA